MLPKGSCAVTVNWKAVPAVGVPLVASTSFDAFPGLTVTESVPVIVAPVAVMVCEPSVTSVAEKVC